LFAKGSNQGKEVKKRLCAKGRKPRVCLKAVLRKKRVMKPEVRAVMEMYWEAKTAVQIKG